MSHVITGVTFFIHNKKTDTVIDLDTSSNRKVQGWTKHGGANQKWFFESDGGSGYHIKNSATGTYLTINGGVTNGQKLIAYTVPFSWKVWKVGDNPITYKILVDAEHNKGFDLQDHGNPADGTPIQLWTYNNTDNQIWRLEVAK